MKGYSGEAIPREIALKLRRNSKRQESQTVYAVQGCVKFSKGEPVRMCFSCRPDNRGCGLVNKRYDLDSAAGRSWNLQTPTGKDICHAFELTIVRHALFSKIHG